jgi:hypothetical protein
MQPMEVQKAKQSFSKIALILRLKRIIASFVFILAIPVVSFSQDPVIVFSENFDTTLSVDPWPYHSQGWISSGMCLKTEEEQGNVLTIRYSKGEVETKPGLGNYRIPLESAYKELYLSFEYYLPEDFDFGFGDNRGDGKLFAGGSMANIPHNFTVDNDGDQCNKLLEIFVNDTMIYEEIGTKVVNSVHPEYLIEHIYLTCPIHKL